MVHASHGFLAWHEHGDWIMNHLGGIKHNITDNKSFSLDVHLVGKSGGRVVRSFDCFRTWLVGGRTVLIVGDGLSNVGHGWECSI
jgi:hypothetical protein